MKIDPPNLNELADEYYQIVFDTAAAMHILCMSAQNQEYKSTVLFEPTGDCVAQIQIDDEVTTLTNGLNSIEGTGKIVKLNWRIQEKEVLRLTHHFPHNSARDKKDHCHHETSGLDGTFFMQETVRDCHHLLCYYVQSPSSENVSATVRVTDSVSGDHEHDLDLNSWTTAKIEGGLVSIDLASPLNNVLNLYWIWEGPVPG